VSTVATRATPLAATRRRSRHRMMRLVGDGLTYAGLAVALVFFLGPFFWILTTSLKGNEDFFAYPPVWIPNEPSLTHYIALFTRSSGARYFTNSLVISSLSMFAALAVSLPTAYSIARWKFGGGFLIRNYLHDFPLISLYSKTLSAKILKYFFICLILYDQQYSIIGVLLAQHCVLPVTILASRG